MQVVSLKTDGNIDINGFTLVGLNTASFKSKGNYEKACSDSARSNRITALREACPEAQIESLHRLMLRGNAEHALLFTHVPDLKDPYRHTPAWDIPGTVRKTWEDAACGPNLVGIFAGHLHDSNRALYGSTSATRDLASSTCAGEKTWVAPPLALKNQLDKVPQARGFLLTTVTDSNTVHAEVHWFEPKGSPAVNQPAASAITDQTRKCPGLGFFLVLALLDVAVVIAGLIWLRASRLRIGKVTSSEEHKG